ncbi:hypothetical protein GH714_023176 [Hevea brasiliensis]|uniref:RING-type domain-containing protein n=1 Tax=Hevea brasiliensis TaxID=3981 RepID=A0A6A6KS48_HEVBR|nr:hypothetical protein GH714_023176 [Hevea brasiliensis]
MGRLQIFEYNGSALIAMVGKNCFAIASDRRLGVQLQTIATDFQRIYKFHDRLFMGLSGLATDAQTLFGPYFCQPVIAGLSDENKPFICTMDSIGAKELAKDFVAGTASESLYGACEAVFKPDMEPEELFETVSQALLSSVDRDCLSGWGGHIYVVSVCGSTWDFICYIENFCIASLLKLAMVLALFYIVLLFFYLLYKLGICECVARSLWKMLWACMVSWFSLWEYCCFCLCDTLTMLKRVSHHHTKQFSSDEFDTSEDDYHYAPNRTLEMRRSLSGEMRDYRRVHHLRKSLRPRSHRIRVGFSKESEFSTYGRNYLLNKHRNHGSTVHNIRVIHSSKFARKGTNLRPKIYSRVSQDRKRPMDDEERKQAAARRVPFADLDQVHSDFAIAVAVQEQERAFNTLTSIESDSEGEGIDEDSSEENNGNDYEFFETQDLEFLEGHDSNSDEDMEVDEEEEDDIDLDELSYEELIALGEFIGEEKRGLSKEEIWKSLRPCKYEECVEKRSGIDRCVICQVEYEGGESLVALPCDHPYHSECITNWLQIKKICPICTSEVSSTNNIC